MKKLTPLIILIVVVPMFLIGFWKIFPIKYKDIIVEYSEQYNLKPELVSSIINAESSFNKDCISDAGAVGLMQVLPSTAGEVAKKLNYANYDLHNPRTNIEFGCYYLNYLLQYYNGDLIYSLCAYNAGINNVKYWDFEGDVSKIPINQTKNYVKKILNSIEVYKVFYY